MTDTPAAPPLSTAAPLQKPRVRVPAGRGPTALAPYRGADGGQATALWRTWVASADADYLYDRDTIVARARDLVRNDGAASAAVTRAADLVVGHRFTLAAKPDAEALGIDRATARALGRAMEREFRAWGDDPRRFCHRQRRLTFAGMLQLMARQIAGPEGEALGVLAYDDKRLAAGARYATTLDVVDPDRLSNPSGQLDSDTLRGGVEMDLDGAPVRYHVRKRHPVDVGVASSYTWEAVPAETPWGRPVVLHWFEHERAGQSRGVSRFAAILATFRQLGRLTEAELDNAVLNALFGAFVKTGSDAASIAQSLSTETGAGEYFDARTGFYGDHPVVMNGLRVPVLMPGDEIQLNTSPRNTGDYVQFRASFLQSVASALGLSYEQLAMDFSRTNYSSARAALNEVWRTVQARRQGLVHAVAAPLYFAVMEEAFARGYVTAPPGAPSFDERPDAYCRALWIGAARGSVDPVKDRQAVQVGIEVGVTTLEQACAEEGLDYEDVLDQQAFEAAARAERGLSSPNVAAVLAVVPPSAGEQRPPTETPPPDQAAA